MYIKVRVIGNGVYDYQLHSANHRVVMTANSLWVNKGTAIRAAKRMARRISVGFKGV